MRLHRKNRNILWEVAGPKKGCNWGHGLSSSLMAADKPCPQLQPSLGYFTSIYSKQSHVKFQILSTSWLHTINNVNSPTILYGFSKGRLKVDLYHSHAVVVSWIYLGSIIVKISTKGTIHPGLMLMLSGNFFLVLNRRT